MKILITGFAPFGSQATNASYEAVKLIADDFEGVTLIKKCVPTVFYKSIAFLKTQIDLYQPDIILMIGEAGGNKAIAIERVALNIDDARICDNEGQKPIDTPIIKGGEIAYFSTLPIKYILESLKVKQFKATISNSAGTYVCNHLMYGVLDYIKNDTRYENIMAGFIHVPYYEDQLDDHVDLPFMPLQETADALHEVIECLLTYQSLERT